MFCGEARREVGVKLAAIVIHSPTGADDDLVVEHLRAPGDADARGETPLTARQGGVADARSSGCLLFPATIKPLSDADGVVRSAFGIVVVIRRIEIEEVAVFLGQAAVPVEAQPSSDIQIGSELEFILDIFAGFVGAPVAVGVADQPCDVTL